MENSAAPTAPSRPALSWGPWAAGSSMWASIAVLGSLWLFLIDEMRADWSVDPQYSYGWMVPFFSLYLFWKRWPSRPTPCLAKSGEWRWMAGGVAALGLGLGCIRVVRESAPDWRLLHWSMALGVVTLSLAAVAYMGGGNSVRHFAWPVAFILVAIPWPSTFEGDLTQSLMRTVAEVASEILGWAGVYAAPQGNLIALSSGVVGVDEACSGVRSLQSMWMASLFLGELNRYDWPRRVALLLIGLVLALCFNVARTLFLVTLAVQKGLNSLQAWHDSAGLSILVSSFIALCAIAHFFLDGDSDEMPGQSDPEAVNEAADAVPWRPLPRFWLGVALGFWILAEGGTALWYGMHERGRPLVDGWALHVPETLPGFKDLPISGTIRQTLAYNEGRSVSWKENPDLEWRLFAFKWYPSRTSTQKVRFHRPEICLSGSGNRLVEEHPMAPVPVGTLSLPFEAYEFERQGQLFHVFFCLWEDGNPDAGSGAVLQDWSALSRLQRVWKGQRNLGQQNVEIILLGMNSLEDAEAAFRARIPRLFVPVPVTR